MRPALFSILLVVVVLAVPAPETEACSDGLAEFYAPAPAVQFVPRVVMVPQQRFVVVPQQRYVLVPAQRSAYGAAVIRQRSVIRQRGGGIFSRFFGGGGY